MDVTISEIRCMAVSKLGELLSLGCAMGFVREDK